MTERINWDFYENVIVYNALMNRDYLASIIDQTDPTYFNNKDIRAVFKVIESFFHKRNDTPTLTELKTYLNSDDDKQAFRRVIESFKDLSKKYNRDELYENSEQFLKERAVYTTMLEVADQCAKADVDTAEIYDKFNKACGISLSVDKGHDYFEDIDAHVADLLTTDRTISSTWPWLDEKLGGGYMEQGRALYVFAGETNIGKSIFLGNTATNIAKQHRTVLLITLEMSELMYSKRLSSDITKIPLKHLSERTDQLKDKVLKFKDKHRSRVLIKEFPPNTVTCNQIRSFTERLVNSGIELDAIVVDYVNLLKSNRGTNSYERVKYATEELRALSYIFNCPIITATQLNRSGYNEVNPELDTISESIGLAATADAIFGIWQEEEDAELGIIKLGLMKNRFGPNFGSVTLNINYDTLTITDDFEQQVEQGTSDINAATSALSFLSN
jgi:replicative DNA helicase